MSLNAAVPDVGGDVTHARAVAFTFNVEAQLIFHRCVAFHLDVDVVALERRAARRRTCGQIQLFGQDVSRITTSKRAPLRRRIGIVFQDFRLLEHLTTWENVALPLRVIGKRLDDYKEDVTDLLQWVGLGDRMHGYPSVLSGGEKQRAAIARAVIGKPELLLADEPTGNVDPQMARRLLRLFIELNRLAKRTRIARSVLLREAVDDLLAKHKRRQAK